MQPRPLARPAFSLVLLAMLPALALAVLALAAPTQGPVGDPTLPPRGLTVVCLDVGQGDATILVGPTGTAMVVDGGPEGAGRSQVIPALRNLGVTQVQFAVASHYHTDHIGGLDEVIDGFPVLSVWDRGLTGAPTTTAYRNYARAAGTRRNAVRPGTSFVLGGGAKVTVLAASGSVLGGATYPIGGTNQFENAASVVLRLEYGDFSMWLGGDLTGGGNSTFDMEGKVAPVCGDVDVYHVNHHGSNTSSSAALLAALDPEVSIASNAAGNSFGHPTTGVTNRINPAGGSRLFLSTSPGAGSYLGYESDGTVTIHSDGFRYRVTGSSGGVLDLYTDEAPVPRLTPGALVISELHRRPSATEGEYLELYCRGPGPANLRGLSITGNGGAVTIRTPYRLLPGDRLLLLMQGDSARNGALPFGHCLPFQAIGFGGSSDDIRLRHQAVEVDRLIWSSLAGGFAVAAERVDLYGSTTTANFAAATRGYGTGDKGTPGSGNSVDKSRYPPVAAVEVLPARSPGGRAVHLIATAPDHRTRSHAMALSLGTTPGMTILGTHIPLNPDLLFEASLRLPGVLGAIPADGRRGLRLQVPLVPGLQGLQAYFGHVILDPSGPTPFPAASNAVGFVFP